MKAVHVIAADSSSSPSQLLKRKSESCAKSTVEIGRHAKTPRVAGKSNHTLDNRLVRDSLTEQITVPFQRYAQLASELMFIANFKLDHNASV